MTIRPFWIVAETFHRMLVFLSAISIQHFCFPVLDRRFLRRLLVSFHSLPLPAELTAWCLN
jgi:hypothetical protein